MARSLKLLKEVGLLVHECGGGHVDPLNNVFVDAYTAKFGGLRGVLVYVKSNFSYLGFDPLFHALHCFLHFFQ
jgi:hypothetical protein